MGYDYGISLNKWVMTMEYLYYNMGYVHGISPILHVKITPIIWIVTMESHFRVWVMTMESLL